MSGIGFSELIILALIGLVILGPERLPRVANQIGGWLGQARRMTRVMKRQLEDELNIDKDFSIKPPTPSREPSQQPEYTPPRDDDDFSPAHAEDDVGTGVGDEIVNDPETEVVEEQIHDDNAEADAVAEAAVAHKAESSS